MTVPWLRVDCAVIDLDLHPYPPPQGHHQGALMSEMTLLIPR